MEPLVSIVIPAYQAQSTIGATLSSALRQSYPRVEIVVCIDGATDRTRDIVAAHGSDIRIVDQANAGLPAARNAAIRAARGDLIATLDADDLLLPTYIASLVERLGTGGERSFVCANSYLMSSDQVSERRHWTTRHPRGAEQRMRTLEHNIGTAFALYPKRMWEELGGYAEELRACEDYDFWTRAIFGGWEVLFVDRPLALYRYEHGSMSSDPERMNVGEKLMWERIARLHRDQMTPRERELLDLSLESETVDWYLAHEAEALARGDVAEAGRLCTQASRLRPSDRSLRLKATLLTRVPGAGMAYDWRARRRLTRGGGGAGGGASRASCETRCDIS